MMEYYSVLTGKEILTRAAQQCENIQCHWIVDFKHGYKGNFILAYFTTIKKKALR